MKDVEYLSDLILQLNSRGGDFKLEDFNLLLEYDIPVSKSPLRYCKVSTRTTDAAVSESMRSKFEPFAYRNPHEYYAPIVCKNTIAYHLANLSLFFPYTLKEWHSDRIALFDRIGKVFHLGPIGSYCYQSMCFALGQACELPVQDTIVRDKLISETIQSPISEDRVEPALEPAPKPFFPRNYVMTIDDIQTFVKHRKSIPVKKNRFYDPCCFCNVDIPIFPTRASLEMASAMKKTFISLAVIANITTQQLLEANKKEIRIFLSTLMYILHRFSPNELYFTGVWRYYKSPHFRETNNLRKAILNLYWSAKATRYSKTRA